MNTKININEEIFKKHKVKLAYLFGSRAKGAAVPESDFDIAVLFEKPPTDTFALRETMDISSDLRKKNFPMKFDVVSLHNAPLLLKYEAVAHHRILFCKDEKERINFEVAVTKEYIDEEHTRNIYYNALKDRIKKRANK